MGVGSELQELGRFLDDCERRAEAVDSLNVVEVTGVGDQRLTADLELRLSIESLSAGGTSLCDPRIGPDGTVRFALEPTTGLPLSTDHDVSVTPTDVAVDDENGVTVTLAATVPADAPESEASERTQSPANQPTDDDGTAEKPTGAGTTDADAIGGVGEDPSAGSSDTVEPDGASTAVRTAESTDTADTTRSAASVDGAETNRPSDTTNATQSESTTSDDGTVSGADGDTPGLAAVEAAESGDDTQFEVEATPTKREVPPFKDRELLAEVYESCDTFAQMAEEIPMDVTGETVRRYMIQQDIHEPTSYQTSGDDTAGQPVALADGIGLPDDVTVETLIETVKNSNTIHQVKRDIDIEREDALEMLKELNLLDLVVGRLATEGEREITRDDVIECLREASAVQ